MKTITRKRHSKQSGFSLVELLITLLVMGIVIGITLNGVNNVQKRNMAESGKLDMTEQAREALDQIVRDLHQAGWPTAASSPGNAALPGTQATTSTGTAQSSVTFNGDINGDGNVATVTYQTVPYSGSACPCQVQRTVTIPAGTNTSTVLDNVMGFWLTPYDGNGTQLTGADPTTKRIDIRLDVVTQQSDVSTKKQAAATFYASARLNN